ncbi:MAG: RNA polymerase sigma factor [Deltaproteobacteria bacterium]|nr:RNA polymerase sigma factor [Deltaproteobacteria bacterium]
MIARARDRKCTDAELMEMLAKGEMDPLGEIYLRYGGAVRSLLWRLLPGRAASDAEDLCQEVFMTVYETAARFQLDREIRPWVYGITVRKARSWRRKSWVRENLLRKHAGEGISELMHTSAPPDSADATRYQINRAMGQLPPAQREVLVLYVAQNMSGEQIADTLGVRINTVWTRLRRARLAMREALDTVDTSKPEK